jgi:NADPH-dependent 2,4-dienoyl-CoA reductase/sulfur reductase-like enzyme
VTAVVVGASVAGVRTAQALRTAGYDGGVVLVGAEPDLPYDKPPLSKALLAGTTDVERVRLLTAADADASGIELRLGSAAVALDPAARIVTLADGSEIGYDQIVVATGAAARPSPWGTPAGMHLLRSMDGCLRLRSELQPGTHLVVIGGGFIGAEVAGTARGLGLDVTVVDPLPVPIGRVLGDEIGAHLTAVHAEHGVATRFGTGVEGVGPHDGGLRIRLTDGSVLDAACAVVGIGAVPNDDWLRSSGLLIDDGLVCDEYCRAVDRHDVHGVGDVARWYHPRHRERVREEHWTNAVEQAATVAHNITHPDEPRPHDPVEYVWSDQYDWKIQICGRPSGAEVAAVVGEPGQGRRFAALYANPGGTLAGGVTVNWPRAQVLCRRALRTETPAAGVAEELTDLHRNLKEPA